MFAGKAVFTNAGRNLLAGIHDGGKLKITRAEMGDGTLGSQKPETVTALLSPVVTQIQPKTISAPFEGRTTVRFDSDTVDIPRDFWWREWGVYAQNVETGEEVLYVYNNAGDKADYITAGSGNTITLAMTIYIGLTSDVKVVIDPSVAYARYDHTHAAEHITHGIFDCGYFTEEGEVAQHNMNPFSHGNMMLDGNADSPETSGELAAHENDPYAHPNLIVDGNTQ